jgi:hypothetical protein
MLTQRACADGGAPSSRASGHVALEASHQAPEPRLLSAGASWLRPNRVAASVGAPYRAKPDTKASEPRDHQRAVPHHCSLQQRRNLRHLWGTFQSRRAFTHKKSKIGSGGRGSRLKVNSNLVAESPGRESVPARPSRKERFDPRSYARGARSYQSAQPAKSCRKPVLAEARTPPDGHAHVFFFFSLFAQ